MPRKKFKNLLGGINYIINHNALVDFFRHNREIKIALYVLILISFFSILGLLKIGPVSLSDVKTLTVIGSFSSHEYNRAATYIATISNVRTDKDALINEINSKTIELIEQVNGFGIDKTDIKTTNNYIYEVQDPQILSRYRANQKVWEAGTSVEIKLRDINKAENLTILLTSIKDTELYGPSYFLDEEELDDAMMLSEAVRDAKEKAEYLADSQDRRLGNIISIEEIGGLSYRSYGDVLGLGSGGASPNSAPGSTKVTKTVKVRFELY